MQNIDLPVLISAIITIALGVTALFMIISIGQAIILVMDHGNNEDKKAVAHAALKNAILGFILVMIAGNFAPSAVAFAFNAAGYAPSSLL